MLGRALPDARTIHSAADPIKASRAAHCALVGKRKDDHESQAHDDEQVTF